MIKAQEMVLNKHKIYVFSKEFSDTKRRIENYYIMETGLKVQMGNAWICKNITGPIMIYTYMVVPIYLEFIISLLLMTVEDLFLETLMIVFTWQITLLKTHAGGVNILKK